VERGKGKGELKVKWNGSGKAGRDEERESGRWSEDWIPRTVVFCMYGYVWYVLGTWSHRRDSLSLVCTFFVGEWFVVLHKSKRIFLLLDGRLCLFSVSCTVTP
jgi:hypothetical protein